MSRRTVLTVVLALLFGASAAIGINLLNQGKQKPSEIETAQIVVAAVNIPRGRTVTAAQLKTRDWPKDLLPEGAITKLEDALDRASLNAIVKDEPLLDGKLATKGVGPGLAVTIPSGMRAFTIHTPTASSGVAGFILPGNKVDVLLTVSGIGANDTTGGGSTTTLLQKVEILAVDQRLDAPIDNKVDTRDLRSVTLLVTPDQVGKLTLAQDKGTLHLSLRNPEDEATVETQLVTLLDLRLSRELPTTKPTTKDEVSPGSSVPAPDKNRGAPPIMTLRGTQMGFVQVRVDDNDANAR